MERRTRVAVFAVLAGVALLLSGCAALPGNAAPVVKIGVIAPFEGAGRPLGYAVLPAIKAVVAEANASGRLGRYRVAVVAFNDNLDPGTAAEQAKALTADGDVTAVIGPFAPSTDQAAAPIMSAAHLASLPVLSADPLKEDYGEEIALAEAATRKAIDALAADIAANGRPTRAGVAERLALQP